MEKIKQAFDQYYNAMSASKAARLGPAHAVWNGFAAGYAAAEQAQQAEPVARDVLMAAMRAAVG